jgi:predicted 2-oxoglutarate/Fe(II)-dependent dioxygenase YbiX
MNEILLSDLIHINKGVLTPDECDEIILEREDRNNEQGTEHCLHAITGVDTHSTFKQVSLIPNTKNFNIVHRACQETIDEWTDNLKKKESFAVHSLKESINFSHMYRLMRYDVGGWIHPHIDWTHGVVGSLTIALNDTSEFEGGEFKFFNGNHIVHMEKGDALIFPANPFFVHEVTEVTKGSRYSVNSFLTSVPLDNMISMNQYVNEIIDREKENPIGYNQTTSFY